MLINKPSDIPSSEITSLALYRSRRQFLQAVAAAGTAALLAKAAPTAQAALPQTFNGLKSGPFNTDEKKTPLEDVTRYNNFYEFGTDKEDPAANAKSLKPDPWSVTVEGHCEKPGTYALEDFIKPHTLEERIYRHRCVEAWSMVIPWVGIPLADVVKRLQPTSAAKYVEFTTLLDPEQMPAQKSPILDWPYVEGLRIDEATHPLALLAVGLYGKALPNQNGAPLRLVTPWKYGFKGIKSIVKLRFTENQPLNTWQKQNASEYGFYANVNPAVDHPRWSQKRERRIGEWFKRDTLPFNGYAEQVAQLYAGMDPNTLY